MAAGGKGKFGFFDEERPIYEKIATKLGLKKLSADGEPPRYARHPLVYLVEAADDICYEIMDLEDAYKLKILNFEEASSLMLGFFSDKEREHIMQRIAKECITDRNEQINYFRACSIGKLVNLCTATFVEHEEEILEGAFTGSLIDNIEEGPRDAYRRCMEVAKNKIYNSKPVLDIELSGYRIMDTLMKVMTEAAVHPDRFYSKQLINRVSNQYDIHSDSLDTRILAVIDYISGMTDVYALDIYQKINGISLPIV